jgi:hypothetical protein
LLPQLLLLPLRRWLLLLMLRCECLQRCRLLLFFCKGVECSRRSNR